MPILYGPDGEPLNTSDIQRSRRPRRVPPKELRRTPQWLARSWAGLLAGATIAGCAIAVYVMRPILVPSLEGIGSFNAESARLTITNNGQLAMHKVEDQCQATKVVFAGRHTLDASRFRLLFTERQIPEVNPGESFPVNCVQAWHLYVSDKNDSGILVYGDTAPGGTQFIWAFQILPDNSIRVTHNPKPGDHIVLPPPPLAPSNGAPVTGVDMTITIDYGLFFDFHRFTKQFRYITQPISNNELGWVLVPKSHSPIHDGIGGLNLTLQGGPTTVTVVSK